jgi:hypothetical protein
MGKFRKNLSAIDRIVRFVIVDLLLGMSYLGEEIPMILAKIAFILSLILIVTIIVGYSPVYHILGISTREKSEKNE